MKLGIILLTLIIYNSSVISQNQILLIPLNSSNIDFDRKTKKNLRNNEISIDSIEAFILSKSSVVFQQKISQHNALNINIDYTFTDSLKRSSTSRKQQKLDSLSGVKKFIIENEDLNKSKYQSRRLNKNNVQQLNDLFTNAKLKYIVVFNKFETTTPRPFCNKTHFSIHIDIYDRSLNKVYGGKSVWKRRITKTMYHSTLKYYIESMLDQYFSEFGELKD